MSSYTKPDSNLRLSSAEAFCVYGHLQETEVTLGYLRGEWGVGGET